jgi:hypothetical protein
MSLRDLERMYLDALDEVTPDDDDDEDDDDTAEEG